MDESGTSSAPHSGAPRVGLHKLQEPFPVFGTPWLPLGSRATSGMAPGGEGTSASREGHGHSHLLFSGQ